MFALKRQAAQTETCDVNAAVQRVLRQPASVGLDGKGPGVVGACERAVGVLEEALRTLRAASGTVREAAGHVIEAASADDAQRALLAERYDDARRALDDALTDASEETKALLQVGAERLAVDLKGATYAVSPFPLCTDEYGLDLPPPTHGFVSHAEVADTLRRVEIALERISRAITVYEEDTAFLRLRAARG